VRKADGFMNCINNFFQPTLQVLSLVGIKQDTTYGPDQINSKADADKDKRDGCSYGLPQYL